MNLFLVSDTHFGHEKMITTFKAADGTPARKFANVEEMDELMIANWNAVVRPQDHIYHLGDVTMKLDIMDRIMPRLQGHKRLVRGNHDIFKTDRYLRHFDEIHGVRVLDNLLCTHIPVRADAMGRFRANVHGHVHLNSPFITEGPTTLDYVGAKAQPRLWVNICVEIMNYTPIALEDLKSRLSLYGIKEASYA
mgnify:CR=1 FL=1